MRKPDALSAFRDTLEAQLRGASGSAIEATRLALGNAITRLFLIGGVVLALAALVALFLPQPRAPAARRITNRARRWSRRALVDRKSAPPPPPPGRLDRLVGEFHKRRAMLPPNRARSTDDR